MRAISASSSAILAVAAAAGSAVALDNSASFASSSPTRPAAAAETRATSASSSAILDVAAAVARATSASVSTGSGAFASSASFASSALTRATAAAEMRSISPSSSAILAVAAVVARSTSAFVSTGSAAALDNSRQLRLEPVDVGHGCRGDARDLGLVRLRLARPRLNLGLELGDPGCCGRGCAGVVSAARRRGVAQPGVQLVDLLGERVALGDDGAQSRLELLDARRAVDRLGSLDLGKRGFGPDRA